MNRKICTLVLPGGTAYQITTSEKLTPGNRPLAVCDVDDMTEVIHLLNMMKDIVKQDVEVIVRGKIHGD